MDLEHADLTPGQEWRESLNATCNRLSTQYLNLIKAAAAGRGDDETSTSTSSAATTTTTSAATTGAMMTSLQDPPPPALATRVLTSSLQGQLAVENLCVAAAQLLSLIRQLRLSLLLMDEETVSAEEAWQTDQLQRRTRQAREDAHRLEMEWIELRNRNNGNDVLE